MPYSKSIFLLITFYLICGVSLSAQITNSISLGPDFGIPGKRFGSGARLGIGGSLDYQLKLSVPVGLQIHAGYIKFSDKNYSDTWVSFVPIRLGIVGFIYQDLIFAFVDAGISHYHASTTTKQNGFSFGLGGGYKLFFNPDKKQFVQLSAYYNLHNFKRDITSQNYNYTWFNIRAAYGLSFGKRHIVN